MALFILSEFVSVAVVIHWVIFGLLHQDGIIENGEVLLHMVSHAPSGYPGLVAMETEYGKRVKVEACKDS